MGGDLLGRSLKLTNFVPLSHHTLKISVNSDNFVANFKDGSHDFMLSIIRVVTWNKNVFVGDFSSPPRTSPPVQVEMFLLEHDSRIIEEEKMAFLRSYRPSHLDLSRTTNTSLINTSIQLSAPPRQPRQISNDKESSVIIHTVAIKSQSMMSSRLVAHCYRLVNILVESSVHREVVSLFVQ